MHICASGNPGRTITARILPDSDLVEEIITLCKENGLEAAAISTCIGSLKQGRFVYAVPDGETFFKMRYSDPVTIQGPVEFLAGQGIVAKGETGEYLVHLHALMSDPDMNVYGGHVVETGNIVLATMDLVLDELDDIRLTRKYHKESGFYFFTPEEAEKGGN